MRRVPRLIRSRVTPHQPDRIRLRTINEDATFTFATTDFGFSDQDAGDTLGAVRVDTLDLPSSATLKLTGTNVTAGEALPQRNWAIRVCAGSQCQRVKLR